MGFAAVTFAVLSFQLTPGSGWRGAFIGLAVVCAILAMIFEL